MFGGSTHTKLPHALRFIAFLLRAALGLTFFYVGYTSLFNPQLGLILQGRSVSGLYAWLNNSVSFGAGPHAALQWAFLVIGACLLIGLFTRLTSLAAIVLVLASYTPGLSVSYSISSIAQFINDELIVILSLFVLIAARAGHYLGLDMFVGFSRRRKNRE